MAEEYIVPMGIDSEKILSGFRDIEQGLDRLDGKADALQSGLKDALNSGAAAAGKLDNSLAGVAPELDRINKQANAVESQLNQVRNASKGAFDDSILGKFGNGVNKIKGFFKDLGSGIKEGVRDGFKQAANDAEEFEKRASKAVRGVNNEAGKSKGIFGGLGQTILGVFGGNILTGMVSGLVSLGKKAIDITAEFQKFDAVLTNTLGSKGAAKEAMDNIVSFATKTPFQVDELTESFVKFANRGVKLTNESMTKLGDIAASQGKSFDQLTEAALDAQGGEFERLKEFGIKASKAGDTVSLSFKGVTKNVKNSATEIQGALESFGDLDGVKGGMDAISKTLGGQLSNLEDNFTGFLRTIGDGASGGLAQIVGLFNELLSYANGLIKSGAVAEFFAPITYALGAIWDAGVKVVQNIKEWGESTGVFKLMGEYVEQGKNAIGGLLQYFGLLIDATVDFFTETKVGQGIVSAVTGAFKLLLNAGIGVFKAVQQIPFVFAAMRAAGGQMVDNLVSSFKILGENLEIIRLKVKKAFTFDDDAVAGLEAQIEAAEKRKQQLAASQKSPAQAAQEAYDLEAGKAAAAAKAKAAADAKQKAIDDKADAAARAKAESKPKGQSAPATAKSAEDIKKEAEAKKKAQEEAHKKAIELQEKQAAEQLQLTRALRDAEIEAMADGYDKERAKIQEQYKRKKEDLEADKTLTAKAAKDKADLIAAIEAEGKAKVQEVTDKENKAKLLLELAAQKELLGLQKESTETQLKLIDIEYDEKAAAVREKYKGLGELETQLLEALEAQRTKAKNDVGFAKERADAEAQNRLRVAMVEAYGDKMLAVNTEINATEQELTGGNKKQLEKIHKSKQLTLLAIEIDTAKKLADIALKQYGADSEQSKLAAAQVAKLQTEFGEAVKNAAGTVDIAGMFAMIGEIGNGDLAGTLSKAFTFKAGKDGKSIADSLGLDAEEAQAITESFTAVYSTIADAYSQFIEGQIAEKDKQIEALDEQIGGAEEAYNKELELQRAGYANNVEAKKKELDALQAQRVKEQKDKEALQKKQNQMAQAAILIQGTVTTAEMIAAAAKAFNATAGIPFAGIAMGIAAAASIVGTIVAMKAKAQEAAKFEEGGWTKGASHKNGGIKYRAENHSAGVLELEGDEFVVRKKSAYKHSNLVEALNSDNFSSIDFNDGSFRQMLAQMGISLQSDNAVRETIAQNNTLGARTFAISYSVGSNAETEKILAKIADNTLVTANAEREREVVTYEGGYKIVKKGNVTRKIKIENA